MHTGLYPLSHSVNRSMHRKHRIHSGFRKSSDTMFQGTTEDPLKKEEMEKIRLADKNCRLVKGQVFLWPGAESWEDLWDLDGTITK